MRRPLIDYRRELDSAASRRPTALRGRAAADAVPIDRRNHNISQPPLCQVAMALLAPSEVATPIAECAPETFGYQLSYGPRNL